MGTIRKTHQDTPVLHNSNWGGIRTGVVLVFKYGVIFFFFFKGGIKFFMTHDFILQTWFYGLWSNNRIILISGWKTTANNKRLCFIVYLEEEVYMIVIDREFKILTSAQLSRQCAVG